MYPSSAFYQLPLNIHPSLRFGRLVLNYNRHLFDGTKTATDIAAIVVSLPSEEEVQDQLSLGAQAPSEDEIPAEGDLF
jgi:hypothetical protein